MRYKKLFESYHLAGLELKNRFLMAPMTRSRSTEQGLVPNALMAEYYGQRASAGLIITEATQVSLQGQGYARTPGMYSPEQVEGWKQITAAVHANNSKIFAQLGMVPIFDQEFKGVGYNLHQLFVTVGAGYRFDSADLF